MNAGTLYWSARRCSAADAVAATPGELIVLAAMPAEFTVAARRDGTLVAPDHHAWTVPNACFQLTAFDRERELRWLADGDDGTAVWVAERSADRARRATRRLLHLVTGADRTRALPVPTRRRFHRPGGAGHRGVRHRR